MSILIRNADYVLTVDPRRRIFRNASVAIERDRIVDVGPADAVAQRHPPSKFDRVIDARGKLVMPGFVNNHVHTCEHISRGLIPDNTNMLSWVVDWALPYYASETVQDEYVSALLACADMLTSGTTCFLDAGARFPTAVAQAVDETGIRAVIGRTTMDNRPPKAPPTWKPEFVDELYFSSTEAALAATEEVIREFHGAAEGRLRGWATLIGLGTCSDELTVGAKRLADRYGVGVTQHCSSYSEDVQLFVDRTGRRPVQHLDHIGALGPNVHLVHMNYLSDDDVAALRRSDTKVCQCLGTAIKLAKGVTQSGKFPDILDSGITLCLGSDGTCASGSFDMVRQMYLAAVLYKDMRVNTTLVPSETAIEMATINGARALLWEDQIGSIEGGKLADMVLYRLDDLDWLPLNSVTRNLVYSAGKSSVDSVIVNGRVVVEGGKLLTLDLAEVRRKAALAADQVRIRGGFKAISAWPIID